MLSTSETFYAETRAKLGLDAELAADTLECLLLPAFHPPLALCLVGSELQVWSTIELAAWRLAADEAHRWRQEMQQCFDGPLPGALVEGRDGIEVVARMSGVATSLVRRTATHDEDPLLLFAGRSLDLAVEGAAGLDALHAALTQVRRYFDAT